MAKTDVFGAGDAASRAMELKKELQRLVRSIADDEDYSPETIDRAREALLALRELKGRRSSARSPSLKLLGAVSCPEEFRCPLSKELMRDPVIVATGQTYDRVSILKWLKAGNRTCPQTQQVLSHTILTPNHLIREMISKWCKAQGIELSDPVPYIDEDRITEADRDNFLSLLSKMSSNISEQKEAAKELRLLTKRMPSFRALFGESPEAISQLLNPLSAVKSSSNGHLDLQEDVITTLLNLSIHDNNKKLVAETPSVIPLLMEALRSGTIATRSNAAAALFTLSALDSNKALIGKSGALRPLLDLLEEGHPLAMTDVASAIFNLCILHENRARAVREGAVGVILNKIENRSNVDELLAILAMLSSHQKAIEEMGELGAVPCLLSIIRETSCARNKENCIAILHTICFSDRTKLKDMREEESTYGTISELSRSGTSRAKRKASGILERLNRTINLTHTA
ncbi:U-box domain-containing protein 9 [Punica granatum]|uniref:RING-type E3 ubiquitin transferase n=1 Tax=Punica granatum TaxID=22663 RepID=A0A6P8BR96_PUNGR|nr:U-box domain-containing protein 9 [Punica granatum]